MKRKIGYLVVAALAIFGMVRLYHALTDDFRLGNITHELPYQADWSVPPLSPAEELRLQGILAQPFSYLGKGAQSYAFVSADGRYVLKFFKFKHLRPSWVFEWAASLGLFQEYHAKLSARKQRKLWGVFRAHKLAYDQDRQESGLVFIQLNTTGNPSRMVTIRDKIGIERSIDLKGVTFILQERGETLRAVLGPLLQQDKMDVAKQRLGQILELYASEYRRGMYDHDHGVMRNLGFIGERPIHLDVGKLSPEPGMREKARAREDALLVIDKMNAWTAKNYPRYAVEIEAFLQEKIHQLYD